jgi:hypothetical protein
MIITKSQGLTLLIFICSVILLVIFVYSKVILLNGLKQINHGKR